MPRDLAATCATATMSLLLRGGCVVTGDVGDAVTPVLIGGTDLMGGSGTMTGTFFGVLIVGMLNNIFNLLNVTAYWQMVAKGAIMLAAVYLGYRQAR